MSKKEGVDAVMAELQQHAPGNELDYQFVMEHLQDYGSPRAKLSRLIKDEALIRLRKGLYVLGPRFKHNPYCLELLANLIYGPSYVSLEWALRTYGLIPEHVEVVTSVTAKPGKEVRTPIGNFLYVHGHPSNYFIGVTMRQFSDKENALFATPEKALTDMITIRRGKITSMYQVEQILLEDLRIEESDLLNLDLSLISKIKEAYPHSGVYFLEKWLSKLKGATS